MEPTAYLSLLLIIINVIVSYRGFNNPAFFNTYSFSVDKVLLQKDYKVLVTSGFLHVGWLHLLFNMFSLYIFSQGVEPYLGSLQFMLIYFTSLICGNLFSIVVHRNQPGYTSVGASGAVCGIIFSAIALSPNMGIGFFFLPISIPAWIFGLLYIIYSIYGLRSRADNVGHDAHLAGAIAGLVLTVILNPEALAENYLPILAVFIPSAAFITYIIKNPAALLVDKRYSVKKRHTIDQSYNIQKKTRQQEIDRILEKIHRRGMGSLTQKEKDFLNGNK